MTNSKEQESVPKSLIVFSDGTNNRGGVTHDTNVWRLYQMIDRTGGNQCTFYDDGVGTQDFAPLKILSGAVGAGLSANIREAYTFLVKNYEPGDKIYLFGFSRGAFTVRSLLGFINRCGLVDKNGLTSAQIEQRVKEAFKAYRAISDAKAEGERDKNLTPVVEFIGVWDTVDAVGLPVDELGVLIEWFYRIVLRRRAWKFRDQVISGVRFARQALSIDDERRTFHPNVWCRAGDVSNDKAMGRVDVKQVWFAGVHSNVGGSYPKDGLAYITLEWMIWEVIAAAGGSRGSIRIDNASIREVSVLANQADKLYDSRRGLAGYYRYSPRQLARFAAGDDDFYVRSSRRLFRKANENGLPIEVHASVLDRIRQGAGNYAPLFIDDVDDEPGIAFTKAAGGRFSESRYSQDDRDNSFPVLPDEVTAKLRRLVGYRQCSYSVVLILSLLAVILGLAVEPTVRYEVCSRFQDCGFTHWSADMLKSFVPKYFEKVVDNAYSYPNISVTILVGFGVAYAVSRMIKHRIQGTARAAWDRHDRIGSHEEKRAMMLTSSGSVDSQRHRRVRKRT